MDGYDFLAGEQRYKSSLAGAAVRLHWLVAVPGAGPGPGQQP
jgi:hypothetical protein